MLRYLGISIKIGGEVLKLRKIFIPVVLLSKLVFSEEYIVRHGDTLSTIAVKHDMPLEKLKEINELDGDRIKLGQKLYVGDYQNHIVQSGENLALISKKYGVSVSDLKRINGLTSDRIKPGQRLNIYDFGEHIVANGENLISIAGKYKMNVKDLKNLNDLNGDLIRVGQKLKVGQIKTHKVKSGENLGLIARKYSTTTKELMKVNNLSSSRINPGQELKISGSTLTPKITAVPNTENINFYWPVQWKGVNSRWGYRTHPVSGKKSSFHTGVDLKAPMNTPVKSAKSGTVRIAGWLRGYGKTVIIDHANGYSTLYAHLDSINVKAGQKVSSGSLIAQSGQTGNVTGPHLHLEVRLNEKTMDPMKFRG